MDTKPYRFCKAFGMHRILARNRARPAWRARDCAFKLLAVGPYEALAGELCQCRQRGLEASAIVEQRPLPVLHRAGRRVNQCSPAV